MRRLELHIPTNISFGTEMKFKIGRMIRYTDIHRAVKPVIVSQLQNGIVWSLVRCRYSNCPTLRCSNKGSSIEKRGFQLLASVHVSRGHSLFLHGPFQAHIRKWSCGYAVRGCVIVVWPGVYAFGNGLHQPPFVFMGRGNARRKSVPRFFV